MVYTKHTWESQELITADKLNNIEDGILFNSQNHQEYLSIAGGVEPTFAAPHGAYVMDITMPSNNLYFYDGRGNLVAKTSDDLKSTVISVPNNNALIWNLTNNTIYPVSFETKIDDEYVILATNAYGQITSGYFYQFFLKSNAENSYKSDLMPYMGGVGYKPTFLVHYDYTIDITLPENNTFYIVDKQGNTISKMYMASQNYTVPRTQALFYDLKTSSMIVANGNDSRIGRVLLAYNNWGQITNGYFAQWFFNQNSSNELKSYYVPYMNDKITKIIDTEKSYGIGDEFIFITDTHWGDNEKQSPKLIENIKSNTGLVNVIFGGDVPRAYGSKDNLDDDIAGYNKVVKRMVREQSYFPIVGNHDFTIRYSRDTEDGFTYGVQESYGLFGRRLENYTNIADHNMYYYRDNKANKIRYVFVNTEEEINVGSSWGVQAKVSQSQADWLIDTALNVPDGYQIFVVGHVPIHPSQPSYSSSLDVLRKIFEAVNNKANLSFDTGYGTVVNHDFSNTNTKVIAYLAGHCHKDTNVTDNGLLHITTGCDAHYGDDKWSRTPQTTSEQLFDIFFIDKENSKISTVRIGAGEDRSFNY